MFDQYKACVLQTYYNKKAVGQLPRGLLDSTPGRLQDECLDLFNNRRHKIDMHAISTFFGVQTNDTEYSETIRAFDVDKFRPLDKYIKGKIANTDDKNVYLLAWLIDYKQRPYQFGKEYEAEKAIILPSISGRSREKEKIKEEGNRNVFWEQWIYLWVALAVLIIGGFGFIVFRNKPTEHEHAAVNKVKTGKCMVWSDDHYVPTPCDQPHHDTPVVELAPTKLNRFRKITDTSSITPAYIGRAWYAKIHKKLELFTDSGFHLIDTEIRLKPLTKYMLNKYFLHQKN